MNPGPRKHKGASLRVAIAQGLPVEMWEKTREIIDVRSTNQRKGHATSLMWQICYEADKAGLVLIVQPRVFDDGMTQEQLEKWYGKFGFSPIQQEPVVLMSRVPQALTVARMA